MEKNESTNAKNPADSDASEFSGLLDLLSTAANKRQFEIAEKEYDDKNKSLRISILSDFRAILHDVSKRI